LPALRTRRIHLPTQRGEGGRMKNTPLGFRVDPDLKAALQEGARRDSRSLSSLVVKILTDWARAQGLLK
jgi:hypothetical protein